MKKMRLELDTLAVESFDTRADEKPRGTVVGQECTCPTNCTCPGCPTCENYATCEATCPDTCDNYTCAVTCGSTCRSCEGTCRPIDCPATFDCW